MQTTNSGNKPQHNAHHPNVEEKLEKFVKDFVLIYETKLTAYSERLEKGTGKPGKWADLFDQITSTGMAVGENVDSLKFLNFFGFVQKTISSIGNKSNRNGIKQVMDQLYLFKKDPSKVREELVKAGIEIFQCYESQFTKSTCENGCWQRAITKYADDAVGRQFNYWRSEKDENFSNESITKALLLGTSKKYNNKSTGIPHLKRGHSLISEKSETWNSAEAYIQSGLVTIKCDGTLDQYYKHIDYNTDKYGFRRLFQWELKDKVALKTKLKTQYEEIKQPQEEYRYAVKVDIGQLQIKLLNKITEQDANLMEERLKTNFSELMNSLKEEARNYFCDFEKYVRENFDELMKNQIEGFQKISTQNEQHNEEARQHREELAKCQNENTEKKHNELKNEIIELKNEIIELKNKSSPISHHEQVRTPIWFDVEKPLRLVIERQNIQDRIANELKSNYVVLNGINGIGKKELARKYAHDHCGDYNGNVIWINASTQDTIKESFHRLAKKEKTLKVEIKDKNGDEIPLEWIVGNVYKHFSNEKCLFIFVSAEMLESIETYLPTTDKVHVLITSKTTVWESDRHSICLLPLSDFKDDEACEFVTNVLNIKDDSHKSDILIFVNLLNNFPLALHQALSYIKDKNKTSRFTVADFIKEFEKAPKKQFSNKHLEIVFKTMKITIDKIGNESLNLLNIIAFFESQQITKKMLLGLASGSNEKFSKIIEELVNYSIVSLNDDKEMLNVSGVVQTVCRLELKDTTQEFKVQATALGMLKNKIKTFDNIVTYLPHVLSVWNHAYINKRLIEIYIVKDINKKNPHINYFHLIARNSNFKVFEKILENIEKNFPEQFENIISADDGQGGMPVHYAALQADVRVLQLLIAKGVKINEKKKHGWTPLLLAAGKGYSENVEILLENKAHIEDRTKYGETALHLAARNGNTKIVEILLSYGADPNAQCEHQFTPLHVAAKTNKLSVLQMLLQQPATNVNPQTDYLLNPLLIAAKAGHLECVEALLQRGANVNTSDNGLFTPLHSAACNGNENVVDALLAHDDIDVNLQTNKGNTPLHLAAEKGLKKIVEALIAKNARFDIKNVEDKLAIDLAREQNQIDVIDFISVHQLKIQEG